VVCPEAVPVVLEPPQIGFEQPKYHLCVPGLWTMESKRMRRESPHKVRELRLPLEAPEGFLINFAGRRL
jgi:hypothetical protein